MVLRSNNNKSCNHSKFEAFKAVLNFSKDESRDKQKPLEAGTSGKSGIFSPNILKDSGPEIKKGYCLNYHQKQFVLLKTLNLDYTTKHMKDR